MNIFKKTYLDRMYMNSLDMQLIRESMIPEKVQITDLFPEGRESGRNILKSKTLLLLTLFEEIDSDHGELNYEYLVNEGIISKESGLINKYGNSFQEFYQGGDILELSDAVTKNIIINSRESIIKEHIRQSPPGFYEKNNRVNDRRGSSLLTRYPFHYFHEDKGRVTKYDLLNRYHELAEYVLSNDASPEYYDYRMVRKYDGYFALGEHILSLKFNIEFCNFMSMNENVAFSSSIRSSFQNNSEKPFTPPEILDDLMYLTRADIGSSLHILPAPKSLKDVFILRKSKEIHRFREVLSEWYLSLKEGNSTIENQIRKDVELASKSLKRVKKWREYNKSPISFWINSIGGHIPILSNALTVIDTVGKFTVDWAERRNKWLIFIQDFQ